MTQFRPFPVVHVSPNALLAGVVVVGVFLLPGCGGGAKPTTATIARSAENPWPTAVAALRKDTDTATSRRVLTQLNSGLAVNTSVEQPARLSNDEIAALKELVPLSDQDVTTISGQLYTPLDANYLAQALHLRDAVRGLTVDGNPVATAEGIFAWVCRHVESRPWVVVEDQRQPNGGVARVRYSPCLPPEYVLRRGAGNPLERAYVFLAALQQAGLDGCLVGPPVARSTPATMGTTADVIPGGPFWAVGVRIGKDVLLFDPDRGRLFPAADGKGIGTLAQVQADPGLLKPWVDDKDRPWTVEPETLKQSLPFLAVPLTSLAPRIKTLDEQLPSEFGLKLAIDPVALRDRFRTEAGFDEVRYWNPGGAPFTYTRTLASFLPIDEGGRDDAPAASGRLYERYMASLFPPTLIRFPEELVGQDNARYLDLTVRLGNVAAGSYQAAFVEPPTPREMIQRGQYYAATPILVTRKQQFEAMLQRARSDRQSAEVGQEWLKTALKLYDELSRARLDQDSDPAALADAQRDVDAFWKTRGANGLALIDASVGEAGVAETTYLIAMAKTEEAHRARTGGKAKAAWASAADWWERYLRSAATQEVSFPGRTAHAREMLANVRAGLAEAD